jgi:hypothetical protein
VDIAQLQQLQVVTLDGTSWQAQRLAHAFIGKGVQVGFIERQRSNGRINHRLLELHLSSCRATWLKHSLNGLLSPKFFDASFF